MAIDPVCKMEVDEKAATNFTTHEHEKFYFCSPECKQQFEDDPGKFKSTAA